MDIFDFIDQQQKSQRISTRPSREETLKQAEDFYAKFPNKLHGVSKEEYVKTIMVEYDRLSGVSDEQYEAEVFQKNMRAKSLLKGLDDALAREITKLKKIEQDKKNRKLKNRIKKLFKRISNLCHGI